MLGDLPHLTPRLALGFSLESKLGRMLATREVEEGLVCQKEAQALNVLLIVAILLTFASSSKRISKARQPCMCEFLYPALSRFSHWLGGIMTGCVAQKGFSSRTGTFTRSGGFPLKNREIQYQKAPGRVFHIKIL